MCVYVCVWGADGEKGECVLYVCMCVRGTGGKRICVCEGAGG